MSDKAQHRNRARYDRLKAKGLCASCGKLPVYPGSQRCNRCRAKQANSEHRWRKKGKTRPPVTISEEYNETRFSPFFCVRWKSHAVRFPYEYVKGDRLQKDRLRAVAAALSFRLSLLHEYFPEIAYVEPRLKRSATLERFYKKVS